jgi:hypothetical protein
MAAKAKTVTPAKQFAELLPKITTRELYGVAVAILCEGAARAENYADAAWADDAPREIAEEGLAFVRVFHGLWSWTFVRGPAYAAKLLLHESEKDLRSAWQYEGKADEDDDEEGDEA